MRYVDRIARTLAFCLLFAAWTDSGAAELAAPADDGWHVWQVEASRGGANSCCYRFNDGGISMQGCDLDGRSGTSITDDDCESLDSDRLSVYVRISDGKVARIWALNSSCPVSTRDPVKSLGNVDSQASADWLLRQVDQADNNRRVSEGAMAALSAHEADVALDALTDILEDGSRRQKTREQALFWLAQIDSDAAFDYIDALLSSR